ncbi:MAG: DUF4215 domain-containing protein [Sandaracinaceae bacterium]
MKYGARSRVVVMVFALATLVPSGAWAQAACNSTGTDLTVAGTQSFNTYLPNPPTSASIAAGATSLPVDGAAARGSTPIAAGDLVLIVQMQGAAIDTRNQTTAGGQYGDGAGGDDRMGVLTDGDFTAGSYEWNVADGPVAGGSLPLRFPTQNRYASGETIINRGSNVSVGFRRYQVVRVPVVRDLTIPTGATLTGLPWNGRSGGIVSIDVSRTLSLGGTIDGSGLGFRGGTPIIPCLTGPSECNDNQESIKGEGIVGTPTRVYSRALGVVTGLTNGIPAGDGNRGAPGNAGGTPEGDNDSGGGGGGGGGPGGVGAIGPGTGTNDTRPRGGAGYQEVTRIFMGGGGGSGSLDDRTMVDAVSGQAGGGIVYVRFTSITGTGTIRSNGDGGASQPQEGGGGGGGGGTIFLRTEVTDLSAITIEALGGDGADTVLANDGAGGGGGGGFVILANPTGMVTATPAVNGGAGGTGGGGSGTSGDGGFQQLTAPPVNSNCPGRDTDGDRFNDASDEDDDNDGILDSVETGGLFGALDPSGDEDADGVPNYLDADFWAGIGMAGACVDTAVPAGTCDETPAVIDLDMDGVPNHLDLDADGDGITDVFESGGTDANGDGNPDGCVSVNARGICLDAGGSMLTVAMPPNTDGADGADYLDPDSDGDGIGDAVESNDTNGNGVLNGSETRPTGTDADGDGIDDAYDPDVAGSDPLTPPFAAGSTEDGNGDGTPDWLQLCGDGYTTGMEACDDGNSVDGDTCSNMCLRGDGQACTASSECVNLCDGTRMTCQPCVDDVMGGGADTGCAAPRAHCDTTGATLNVCQPCVDTGAGVDDGCGGATTTCETGRATNRCVPCLDTMTGGAMDDGCPGGAPLCDTSPAGGAPTNVCEVCLDTSMTGTDDGCSGAANVCDTSAGSGMYACVDCLATGALPHNGCDASNPVCVGTGGTQTCLPCADTDPGTGTDDGCTAATPFCTTAAGSTPVCAECRTSADCATGTFCNPSGTCTPGCTSDTDCAAPTPACDTASMTCVECTDDSACGGATPACDTSRFVCVPCVDTAGLPDAGCTDPMLPVCAGTSGPGTAGTTCVECTTSADCGGGQVCEPTSMVCVTCFDSGTDPDEGCTMPTSICDTSALDGRCVECLGDSDCGSGSTCDTGTNRCSGRPDNDGDGVPDDVDIDDDNDGITDIVEGGGTDWSGDTDGDGTPDYADPDSVTCDDADMNGACDSLPENVDFDGDGIPNHLDLDADGDGAPDSTEGHDSDGNGVPDTLPPITFMDADGDGLADAYDIDSGGMMAPVQDTDGDGAPDFLDVDDDGDGVYTRYENPDPNGDGQTSDAQDTDDDGTPDYLDTDDDQDDVPTRFEVPDPNGDGNPDPDAQDTDEDGIPDYLDVDDDGDGTPTFNEGPDPNGDGNPEDAIDTDGDGIPDYLDPDGGTITPTPGGLAGGALCSATPGRAPLAPLGLLLGVLGVVLWRRRRA